MQLFFKSLIPGSLELVFPFFCALRSLDFDFCRAWAEENPLPPPVVKARFGRSSAEHQPINNWGMLRELYVELSCIPAEGGMCGPRGGEEEVGGSMKDLPEN